MTRMTNQNNTKPKQGVCLEIKAIAQASVKDIAGWKNSLFVRKIGDYGCKEEKGEEG